MAIVVILADCILYFILIIVNRCIRTRILSGFGGISADISAKSGFLDIIEVTTGLKLSH